VLSSITKVEVMSRPSLLALNNETANLQVGDQVPIVTQTAISVTDPNAPIVNQTQYRDTGVILKVTLRVRAGGMVELEVAQEVGRGPYDLIGNRFSYNSDAQDRQQAAGAVWAIGRAWWPDYQPHGRAVSRASRF